MFFNLEPWEEHSACATEDSWDWFSDIAAEQQITAEFCRESCPVKRDCAIFALQNGHLSGTWGGMVESQRLELLGVNEFGDAHFYRSFAWCPECSVESMERPPVKSRQKVKRGQVWIECRLCGLGFGRYESNEHLEWITPSASRKKDLTDDGEDVRI